MFFALPEGSLLGRVHDQSVVCAYFRTGSGSRLPPLWLCPPYWVVAAVKPYQTK